MSGHLKFAQETLNQTTSNQITLTLPMQSQTKACISKSSCEICIFMGYYAA
jgi:hypothetical protein